MSRLRKVMVVSADEVKHILHLPLLMRISHPRARRTIIAWGSSVCIMTIGSFIAGHAHMVELYYHVPAVAVDTTGYFLHAIGAVPALRYFEPFWTLILGSAE
jgi:hypothetical protein